MAHFGLKLVTSLFLASLGFGSNHSPLPGTSASSIQQQQPIHQHMSESDLRQVFHVESHEEVPEYNVVHVRVMRSKRAAADNPREDERKEVYLKAFGTNMHLNLKPNREFNQRLESMKLFTAETTDSGLKFLEEPMSASSRNDEEAIGTPHHDDKNMAAVLVRRASDGKILLEGTIGNNLVIKPVPAALHPHLASSSSSDTYSDPGMSSDGRDDDEMFLDEDDVSVKELNHVKKRLQKKDSNNNKSINLSNSTSKREPKKENGMENINIPKLTKLSDNGMRGGHRSAHFVFKKKMQTEGPHHDFASLEPGHLSSLHHLNVDGSSSLSTSESSSSLGSFPANWTLIKASSSSSSSTISTPFNTFNLTKSSNNFNQAYDGRPESFNQNTSSPYFSARFNDTSSSEEKHDHSHRRSKRQSPDTVWPEVLLVVDYDSYLLHGANSRDVKRYFISFWNGVDLRYKLLSHPRIRVSLAGMIVAKDRDATPYLERNRLRAPNADAVDAAGALTDMGKYLYREDRLPTYDLAVVITKLDMCRRRYEGGRCNRGTAGFAYVGGACVVNKRLEKVNSVAIIEDSGGFSGIIVAAHEVGHLLGCVHDGSPPPSYLGGPGATRCPWEDGFIMSDLRHTERGFRWSSCSVEQFKHFLNGETATCLYNYPHENQLLPRVLPGTMLTLDEQCKRDRGTNACFKDARVCAQLFCFDSASGYCVSYRPAAEGSSCGDGQVCRNGKCTAELENIIPDYTHVTQTVARGPSVDRLLSRSDSSLYTAPPPNSANVNSNVHINVNPIAINSNNNRVPPSLNRGGYGRSRSGFGSSSSSRHTPPELPPATDGDFSVQSSHRKKSCRDIIEKMAGSLSCSDFLERFGYRYCNHSYVKRNCCASHAIMCNKIISAR